LSATTLSDSKLSFCAGQAFELRGVDKLDDTNTWTLDSAFMLLERLNLAAPEAAPIVTMLQKIPTALTFVTEHPVSTQAIYRVGTY